MSVCVLQRVLQRVLQCVLQFVAGCCSERYKTQVLRLKLDDTVCVSVCCSACCNMCCSVLQCVAVRCEVL